MANNTNKVVKEVFKVRLKVEFNALSTVILISIFGDRWCIHEYGQKQLRYRLRSTQLPLESQQ